MSEDPGRWRCLVAIVGPPRSGTTVTTAILAAQSSVHAVYEPWNDPSQGLDRGAPLPFADFVARFPPAAGATPTTLVVKETSKRAAYVERIADLMETAPPGVARMLLAPLRDPFHAWLSSVEAGRRWWGRPELVADAESFVLWWRRYRRGLGPLARAARRRNALFVSYHRLVAEPDAIARVTEAAGLTPEDAQRDYHLAFDATRVRGDLNVRHEAAPLSTASSERRAAELAAIEPVLRKTAAYAPVAMIAETVATLPLVVPAGQAGMLMRALRSGAGEG